MLLMCAGSRLAPKGLYLNLLFSRTEHGDLTSVLWSVCGRTEQEFLPIATSAMSCAWAEKWEQAGRQHSKGWEQKQLRQKSCMLS